MTTHWGSKIGFILATAGSAIGLGNIWRFPYLVGRYGGGAFLLLYLLCVMGLGYFILSSKLAFGRYAQSNIIDGFQVAGAKANKKVSKIWGILGGWIAFLNVFLVSATYIIVIGWTLSYVVVGALRLFSPSIIPVDEKLFQMLTSSFGYQYFWGILCIALTSYILVKGVKKGIEQVSLYTMPILFGLLFFLLIWMIFLPDSWKGILFLLKPNFEQMGFTPNGFSLKTFTDLLLVVFGQSIYSLSIGMGVIFVYGSYLPRNTNIKSSARWIVLLDTLVAFLSALIVIPAILSFGMEPNQGPALSFISLPLIFSQMTYGPFLMFLFFILLFLAALTSLISIYEANINILMLKWNFKRSGAVFLTAIISSISTFFVLASLTGTIPFKICGKNLFDFFDMITGSYLMALMALVCCLFIGWKIFPQVMGNLGQGAGHQSKYFKIYNKLILSFVAPFIILILIISSFFLKSGSDIIAPLFPLLRTDFIRSARTI